MCCVNSSTYTPCTQSTHILRSLVCISYCTQKLLTTATTTTPSENLLYDFRYFCIFIFFNKHLPISKQVFILTVYSLTQKESHYQKSHRKIKILLPQKYSAKGIKSPTTINLQRAKNKANKFLLTKWRKCFKIKSI